MERFLRHLNTVLNLVFIVCAAGVTVLAVLSLVQGPTLRYAPYLFALGGVYYLADALKTFAENGRRSTVRGTGQLVLACTLAVLSFITYRCLG